MTNICVIPARGGSQRIPKKNIKMFHGRPIIAYSIETALESGLFDEVYVSTDDIEIANVAAQYGAKAHKRSEELARNEVGTQEVIQDVLYTLGCKQKIDYACCLYATAPLLDVESLKQAYWQIESDRMPAYVVSVGTEPLRDAGIFYWGRYKCFVDSWQLYSTLTEVHAMDERQVCDINTPEDWARAERMYEELHK